MFRFKTLNPCIKTSGTIYHSFRAFFGCLPLGNSRNCSCRVMPRCKCFQRCEV